MVSVSKKVAAVLIITTFGIINFFSNSYANEELFNGTLKRSPAFYKTDSQNVINFKKYNFKKYYEQSIEQPINLIEDVSIQYSSNSCDEIESISSEPISTIEDSLSNSFDKIKSICDEPISTIEE